MLPTPATRLTAFPALQLTARGVSNLLAYWLGENGYKPFLERMRKGKEAAQ